MVAPLGSLWTDTCDVAVRRGSVNADTGRTVFSEETVYTDLPCRLSFKGASGAVGSNEIVHAVSRPVKLFLDAGADIPPGSRITVYRQSRVFEFARSGVAAVYNNHQELGLEVWKGWA